MKALARPASEAEVAEYLGPWTDPRVARSWLALASAADYRCTLGLLPRMRESTAPKLLVWSGNDLRNRFSFESPFPFQPFLAVGAVTNVPTTAR